MRRAAAAIAVIAWAVFAATAAVRILAGDGARIGREMLRAAPAASTGLPESEYDGAGKMIAGYLTGERETFQYEYTSREGTVIRCFGEREQQHMADVRGLIRTDETVMWVSLSAAAALAAAGRSIRGMRIGILAAAAATAGTAIWAAVNFDGFFITFHRIAFRNDLWLLDPRTEMLIRLMPTAFFTRMAGTAGILATGIFILPIAAIEAADAKRRRGKA